jgi:hypothetical protein
VTSVLMVLSADRWTLKDGTVHPPGFWAEEFARKAKWLLEDRLKEEGAAYSAGLPLRRHVACRRTWRRRADAPGLTRSGPTT